MYRIDYDEGRNLLKLTLSGFWQPETFAAFVQDMRKTTERITRQRGGYDLLSDSTQFPVQSAEVSQGFAKMFQAGVHANSGRMAIVVKSMLNKMQAEHVFAGTGIRIFLDAADALAWLDRARAEVGQ